MSLNWVEWHIPAIPVLVRLREEDEKQRNWLKNNKMNQGMYQAVRYQLGPGWQT